MMLAACLVGLAALCGAADDPPADKSDDGKRAKLLKIFLDDARDYDLFRDADPSEQLKLQDKPVYVWTNPLRANGQYGAVYVWTWQGRPEAVGCIFVHSLNAPGQLGLMHEFHTLSQTTLAASRNMQHNERWTPKAGIELVALPGERPPARSASARLVQMRALARKFDVHSVSNEGERWELRLLPQPLYRYNVDADPVIDGGLFAFVTSAGTDPELMLVIEARQTADGPFWHYSLVRFTGYDLFVKFNGKQVWKALHADLMAGRKWMGHDSDHVYQLYRDRLIPQPTVPAGE